MQPQPLRGMQSAASPTASSTNTNANANANTADPVTTSRMLLQQQENMHQLVESRMSQLEHEIAARDAWIEKISNDFQTNLRVIKERDGVIEQLEGQLVSEKLEHQNLRRSYESMQHTMDAKDKQVNELRSRLRDASTRAEDLELSMKKELDAVKLEHQEEMTRKDEAVVIEREKLHEEYAQRMRSEEAARHHSVETAQRCSHDKEALWKKEAVGLDANLQEKEQLCRELQHEIITLKETLSKSNILCEDWRDKATVAQRRCSDVEQQLEAERKMLLHRLEEKNSQFTAHVSQGEASLRHESVKISNLELQVTSMRSENSNLENLLLLERSHRSEDLKRFGETSVKERETYAGTVKDKDTVVREQYEKISRLDSELRAQERRYESLRVELEKKELDVKRHSDHKFEAEQKLKNTERELSELHTRINDQSLVIDKSEMEIKHREKVFDERRHEFEQVYERTASELNTARNEKLAVQTQFEMRIAKLKSELENSEREKKELQVMLHNGETSAEKKRRNDELQRENRELQASVEDLKVANARILDQVKAVTDEMTTNSPLLDEARENARRVASLQKQLGETKTDSVRIEAQLRNKEKQVLLLQQELSDSEIARDSTNKLLAENLKLKRELGEKRRFEDELLAADNTHRYQKQLAYKELKRRAGKKKGRRTIKRIEIDKDGQEIEIEEEVSGESDNDNDSSSAGLISPGVYLDPSSLVREAERLRRAISLSEEQLRNVTAERDTLLQRLQSTTQSLEQKRAQVEQLEEINKGLKHRLRHAVGLSDNSPQQQGGSPQQLAVSGSSYHAAARDPKVTRGIADANAAADAYAYTGNNSVYPQPAAAAAGCQTASLVEQLVRDTQRKAAQVESNAAHLKAQNIEAKQEIDERRHALEEAGYMVFPAATTIAVPRSTHIPSSEYPQHHQHHQNNNPYGQQQQQCGKCHLHDQNYHNTDAAQQNVPEYRQQYFQQQQQQPRVCPRGSSVGRGPNARSGAPPVSSSSGRNSARFLSRPRNYAEDLKSFGERDATTAAGAFAAPQQQLWR